jgi:hypothetical protein
MAQGRQSGGAVSATRSGKRLYLHVAGWPGRCVDCEALVRKGEAMVFRSGGKRELRWCARCGLALVGEITPTRAYLQAFGSPADGIAAGSSPANASAPRGRDPRTLIGRRVRIRRGAAILSDTCPRPRIRVARRSQIVKVVEVLDGSHGHPAVRRSATIRWAGVGGYLREVAVDDIAELVE